MVWFAPASSKHVRERSACWVEMNSIPTGLRSEMIDAPCGKRRSISSARWIRAVSRPPPISSAGSVRSARRRATWPIGCTRSAGARGGGGGRAPADLLRRLGSLGETARDLAYRLYSICERKGWAQEALAYNMLAAAWPRLSELAARSEPKQETLL